MPMKLFNKNSNLQGRLTFYPLFWFAVGLLVTFLCMVTLIRLYLDNYLKSQVIAYSNQIAKDIVTIVDQDQETISAFLLSDTMQDLKNPAKMSVALERLLSQNKNFLEGYIVNMEGQTLVGVSRLKIFQSGLPNFQEQKIYQEAKNDRIGISGWENFTEKYRPYWYMAVPIETYIGEVVGVLVVTIDLRRIEDVILTSQGAKYGDPILIDHNANVLVHLDRSKLGNNWSNNEIAQKVLSGGIGTATYHDDKRQYVLAAYQPLNQYGWGLIVQVPPQQTIYVIRDKVVLLFGFMTVIMFVVTGLLIYNAAGKIVAPIKKLTITTHQFGQGQKLEYQPVTGNDEIAQLSTAFYKMATGLQDIEKQRAQYISMIAHDLRSPLTTIKVFFQGLQRNESDAEFKIKNLELINRRMEQISRMINDLLEFSRLDLGQITFNPEIVSIKYLFEDVITGYQDNLTKFVLKAFADDLCVWADPVRLQQVIQNILDNSLKYTSISDIVTLDCIDNQANIKILISDAGDGIPEEILPELFKPFQFNSLQKRGSFGLGLAIAKKLINGMEGDITVTSVKGEGTTFSIFLPKVNSDLTYDPKEFGLENS